MNSKHSCKFAYVRVKTIFFLYSSPKTLILLSGSISAKLVGDMGGVCACENMRDNQP